MLWVMVLCCLAAGSEVLCLFPAAPSPSKLSSGWGLTGELLLPQSGLSEVRIVLLVGDQCN